MNDEQRGYCVWIQSQKSMRFHLFIEKSFIYCVSRSTAKNHNNDMQVHLAMHHNYQVEP